MALYGAEFVLTYTAWNVLINSGVLGDAANHTLRWVKDGTPNVPDNVPSSEVDAVNTPGLYKITISTTEAECVAGTLAGKSSTENVNILPVQVLFEHTNVNVSGWLGTQVTLSSTTLKPEVDIFSISDDVVSASGLQYQYDGTGLTGDTFPATQSQINQVANVSGQAKRAPSSYVLTTGVQSANTVTATEELDGTRHEHTGVTEMDLYYEFEIGAALPTEVKFTGYLQGNNDDLEVYGYDWVSSSWKQIGELNGQASSNNVVKEYDLLVNMVGSGANEGKVRIRFTDGAFTLSSATLAVDQLLVVFSIGDGAYENGAIWLDTNASNTNTVRGVDGRASNPVSTIAAANTLLASANLSRIEVAPASSVTFAASQENQQFLGKNWTVALGGQSLSGSYIQGADISGIATGANEIHFDHCHFGNVTLPPCDSEGCILEGTFTFGTAGDFFFENCKSGVAGTSTPSIDFGSALNSSNVNFRAYSGGIEIKNMGTGTGSYNMSLEGDGQLVVNANCSATSAIAIRGHFPISGDTTAIAAIIFSDDARYVESSVVDAVWDEILSGTTHNISTSAGRRLREVSGKVIHDGMCQSGSTVNTVVLAAGASAVNGAYDPAMIAIIAGPGSGQSRLILEYTGSTTTAIVDRSWKVTPTDASEYIIYAHPGREHVNEGMAQGGGAATITLNTLASSQDNAYNNQVVFIRSGDGDDQVRHVLNYNGTTKVATVGRDWDIVPTPSSAYVMLPNLVHEPSDVADAILIRNISNVEDTAPEHSLGTLVMAGLNSTVSGVSRYIYKSDQTAVMHQQTVTVEASGDPITGVS
ncbi:hypothetical protein KAR91_24095 [Candidatus Pacearchaeota archaeon]|nr:hypothetical protein [Candidatus Pacearchaeota archaeon]